VNCVVYDKADGLSTLECSGGFSTRRLPHIDGRLWFPTIKGLAVIDPAGVKINPFPPPVLIEEVTVDDQPMFLPGPGSAARLRIQPGKHRFEFHYTGLSLVAPEKVRFKCRLDGLESDWEDVDTRRVAYYSYLKPGDYTFQVTACQQRRRLEQGRRSARVHRAALVLANVWFTGGAVLAGIGAVGGAALYITRRRLHKKMERWNGSASWKTNGHASPRTFTTISAPAWRASCCLSQSDRAEGEDSQQVVTRLGRFI